MVTVPLPVPPAHWHQNNLPFAYAKTAQTVCPYCGVGCTLNLKVVDNKITDIYSTEGNVNDNLPVKGRFAYDSSAVLTV